jgi:NAD(P)-dependent dehydrogenase (short-subunit alcohol dehydrogenase family)
VTGAGAGIGLAAARDFAQAGAAVALADVNEHAVRQSADGLLAAGHKAFAVRCNVTDKSEVAAMVDRTVSAFGRLDAAYNNAGVNCDGVDMLQTGDDEFERILDVNLRRVWNCMKAELRHMIAQGTGAIVNCSSIGGMVGSKGRSAYSASKHAVIGLTRRQRSIMRREEFGSTRSARE